MDKQEYLNQISNKPTAGKKSPGKLFTNKFFLVGMGGLIALIIILIIGAALGGNRPNGKDQLFSMIVHLENTKEVISEYQPEVKSSELRSYSASLYSILSDTSSKLTSYATDRFSYKSSKVSKSITNAETAEKDSLANELFEAKINGILDRIYAHKMAYEISIIAARGQQIQSNTNSEDLHSALTTSYESLNNLYDKFNNFVGTN